VGKLLILGLRQEPRALFNTDSGVHGPPLSVYLWSQGIGLMAEPGAKPVKYNTIM
jgi:hypothetical protein